MDGVEEERQRGWALVDELLARVGAFAEGAGAKLAHQAAQPSLVLFVQRPLVKHFEEGGLFRADFLLLEELLVGADGILELLEERLAKQALGGPLLHQDVGIGEKATDSVSHRESAAPAEDIDRG